MKVKLKDKTIMEPHILNQTWFCLECKKPFTTDKFKFLIPEDGEYEICDVGFSRTVKAKNGDFITPSYTCPKCGAKHDLIINGRKEKP